MAEKAGENRGKHGGGLCAGGAPAGVCCCDGAQPDAGTVIVQELNSGLFQRRQDLGEGGGARADRTVEGLHAANRADGYARARSQLNLLPSNENARRP